MSNTTQDVLGHHLECFGKADLDGIMEDYTDDSIVFTPVGTVRGVDGIRGALGPLLEEFRKPGASFEMTLQDVQDDTAFIVWKAESADNVYEMGTDTFVVRDGKIARQTFAAVIKPKG